MKKRDSSWVGKTFGRWLIIDGPFAKNWKSYYLCKCACGLEKLVGASDLTDGKSTKCRTCGSTKHGTSRLRLRHIWKHIRARCANRKQRDYKYYGGRGITVCQEWKIWENFKNWAITNGYCNNLEIDRIDNEKGYCPENCRWTTSKINQRNKRTNRLIMAFGETKCLSEWLEDNRCAVSPTTLRRHLDQGWLPEKAITSKARSYRERF